MTDTITALLLQEQADNERLRGALQEICAVDKAAPDRKDCHIWADMLAIASYALTGRDSFMSLDELAGAADQPNGATGWIDNAVTPPGESVERVLVAYPTGLVETTQAHYVRLYPTNYPWWMPLPVAPDPTPQPQPDAVASTFADCETAMGMEYTTPPCACAEYYPGLPHHPDCPTRNAAQQPTAPTSGGHDGD